MRSFIKAHLDPVDRLGEVVFSLIMALGFIGACRLELSEADNHAMLIGVFGCNFAWAIVDGVMYVFAALFERGVRAHMIRNVQSATSPDEAMGFIAKQFDPDLDDLTTNDERKRIYLSMLDVARGTSATKARLRKEDIFGGIAAALMVVISTIPVVLPFMFVPNPLHAIRCASAIALVLLFISG